MLKRDYFIRALRSNAGRKKHWMYSVFSIAIPVTEQEDDYPYCVHRKEDGVYFTNLEGDLERIDDASIDRPIAYFRERFELRAKEIPNADRDYTTTYGSVVCNYTILCLPFYDLIPFQEGYFNAKKVEAEIKKRLTDDPDDNFKVPYDKAPDQVPGFYAPDGKIYVRQMIYYGSNIQATAAYNAICVHSVTYKSLFPHPQTEQKKKELDERYKGQLTDPAICAAYEKELQDLDKEWLKDDPIMDFYLKSKYFTTVRRRLHYVFGAESPFSDGSTVKFIRQSLKDGLDVKELPSMINTIREGSYNRGAMTELGGAATKSIYRSMSTVELGSDDCGSTLGMPTVLAPQLRDRWIGCYILVNQKTVELTEDNIDQYLGTTVALRSPMTCKEGKPNFCKCCMGKPNTEIENGLAAAGATVTGILLYVFMAAFHGTALTTRKADLQSLIN